VKEVGFKPGVKERGSCDDNTSYFCVMVYYGIFCYGRMFAFVVLDLVFQY